MLISSEGQWAKSLHPNGSVQCAQQKSLVFHVLFLFWQWIYETSLGYVFGMSLPFLKIAFQKGFDCSISFFFNFFISAWFEKESTSLVMRQLNFRVLALALASLSHLGLSFLACEMGVTILALFASLVLRWGKCFVNLIVRTEWKLQLLLITPPIRRPRTY